jgi:exosortase
MHEEKKPLLPFDPSDRMVQINLACAVLVLAFIGYLYFGVGRLNAFYGGFLSLPNSSYSHAPLIPLVSLGLIWMKRFELFAAPRRVTTWAVSLVVLALLMYYVGYKAEQWRLMLISLVLLLWSMPFYVWGWGVARLLMFPVGFLLFGVPLNFITDLTSPLKQSVSATAAGLLNLAGLAVERDGVRLFSVPHGRFQLEVADACSGINSLIALVTLATVFAYVTHQRQLHRWILIFASVPLALFGNLVRVTLSAVVGDQFGQGAIGTFDKFSTFVVFIPAIAALLFVDRLITTDYRELWARWTGGSAAET